jgi:PilZ domain
MVQSGTKDRRLEKRRSDRLMLTVPLRIEGKDPDGTEFLEEARTVTLNRHGARILITRALAGGSTIKVTNLVSRRNAEFRVVGPLTPRTETGGEWGIECINKIDIWGIQFPPLKEGAESQALLECRVCHGVALVSLSLVEVEVLETSGILSKPCEPCAKITPWGFAEKQVAMGAPNGEAAMLAEADRMARGIEQRRHRRVALQMPVLVRDYYGGNEITKSENVSKGGFCFTSEKEYQVGEGVLVACPYNATAQSIEVGAKIVRRSLIEGSNRKIYGVRYDTLAP